MKRNSRIHGLIWFASAALTLAGSAPLFGATSRPDGTPRTAGDSVVNADAGETTIAFASADPTTSTITAAPVTIAADGSSTSAITVQLKDDSGTNLTTGGDLVTLATTAGSLSGVIDNADGTYTATLTAGITAATATITGVVNGVGMSDDATVTILGAADPATSTITAAPTTIPADGTSTATVTVQVKDGNGTNITNGGDPVTLATTAGSLSGVTDNNDGTYTATLTAGTQAVTATITGMLNFVGMSDNATVTFAGGADPTTSTVTAVPTSISADGSSTSTITVQLKDGSGTNLGSGGDLVTLATTLGSLSGVTDNNDGTHTATLTGTQVGTATITGMVNFVAVSDDATVIFTGADPTRSTITAAPTRIAPDGSSTSTITVQLRYASGLPLPTGGDLVTLATTAGSLSGVTDNNNGTFTATLTSVAQITTATITGTLNLVGMSDNASVDFAGPQSNADPTTSTITAAPTSIAADGSSTSTITVQLKDGSAPPANLTTGGDQVVLATTLGSLSGVTDNNNGTYTATLTGTQNGLATITGTLNFVGMSDNAAVTFTGAASNASPTTSTITAAPTSITADGSSTSTVTVQLKDGSGTNLTSGGDAVLLATTLGSLSGVTDNNNGTYTATLTGTQDGLATITGTLNFVGMSDNAAVTFTGAASNASPTTSTITAAPTSITADGSSTSTITVQLKDGSGTNLTSGGDAVLLATTLGSLSGVTDNNNGTYTATLTGTQDGTATITGTLNLVGMSDNAAVTFTGGGSNADPTTSTITAAPTSITADGTSTSTITVQLKSGSGTNLTSGGDAVLLATTAGSLSGVTDNNNGTYTATLTAGTQNATATITGTLNGVGMSDNAIVTFTGGGSNADPTTSTITAAPTSITADGSSTSTITVQLKDGSGTNLTSGGDLVLLATTAGSLSGVTDNNNGTYTATLTAGTQNATATITGTLNGVGMSDNATVTFTGGGLSADPTTSTITAAPTSITADGTSTSTITVQLKSGSGTNLTNGGDLVLLATTAGSLSGVTDNNNGTYTATLTASTQNGTATITGTLNGVGMSDNAIVTFTGGGSTADPTTSTITAAPTSITADGSSTSTITVQLKDGSGTNLTSGGDAVLLATTAGSLSGVTDNNNGTYTATLTAGTLNATATITGTLNGIGISDNATVTLTGGSNADPTTSTITAAPTSITADGSSTSTITVQLKDGTGTDLTSGGDAVLLATTLGSLSGVTDNSNGTYTATLTAGTQNGTASITGTVNSVGMSDNALVTFTGGGSNADPTTSTITAAPTSITADGSSTSTIAVQLKDGSGTNLTGGGDLVLLATTAGSLSGVTDNNNGTYTATLTAGTQLGTATITGTVNGVGMSDDATVTLAPVDDGDGIAHEVDTDPTNSSSDFSDVALGGTTTGTITDLGDQTLTVTEEPNPDGVRIAADLGGGPTAANVSACGGLATYDLTPGDEVVVTCTSASVTVVTGPVEASYPGDFGLTLPTDAVVTVSEGVDGELTVENDSPDGTDPVVVTVGNEVVGAIGPGESLLEGTLDVKFARVRRNRRTGLDRFGALGRIAGSAAGDGLNVVGEDVTVSFGGFTESIPVGSGRRIVAARGVTLLMGDKVRLLTTSRGLLGVAIRDIDPSGHDLDDPVTFTVRVGDDVATTAIQFNSRGLFFAPRNDPAIADAASPTEEVGFDLMAAPDTATVVPGDEARYDVLLTPLVAAFDEEVTLTCSGVPAGAACAFAPSQVTPGTAGEASVLTVSTTGPAGKAALTVGAVPLAALWLGVGVLLLAVWSLAGRLRLRRFVYATPAALLLLAALFTGCDEDPMAPTPITGTPYGTYVLTITATAGDVERSIGVTLTVGPEATVDDGERGSATDDPARSEEVLGR